MQRRTFLKIGVGTVCGFSAGCFESAQSPLGSGKKNFKISLAQWSFHKRLFGQAGEKMDNLDFAAEAGRLGFEGIEYVNAFFKDKAEDKDYLAEMKRRASDNGVKSLLIMCDGEGNLGDPDDDKRTQAVENHYRWVDAAKFLGCHSIRVNAASEGSYEQQMKLAADGLKRLSLYGTMKGINVIVENHWGLSSEGRWLPKVIEMTGMDNCGTLPDFGNFPQEVDAYEAVDLMMPYAKAVSAKSYDFDEDGNETKIDYYRMMDVVLKHGYTGYVGVEYEGSRLSEEEGIIATKKLLEKIRRGEKA
ncbi:MAG: sugar phosphate isomerase/epimerase [Sedimentisphaerales bacterium]|nr:sugar phosphate isomerase/epimerase [Sedimentisphaerales bacterium]